MCVRFSQPVSIPFKQNNSNTDVPLSSKFLTISYFLERGLPVIPFAQPSIFFLDDREESAAPRSCGRRPRTKETHSASSSSTPHSPSSILEEDSGGGSGLGTPEEREQTSYVHRQVRERNEPLFSLLSFVGWQLGLGLGKELRKSHVPMSIVYL